MIQPPRIPLVLLPTPLHRLNRLSDGLGIDLWIKRDDMTGFALGGNKGRKLEFLMADILEKGCQAVVACGSSQSNFVRQLGAACSMYGIRCAAALMDLPYYAAAGKPDAKAVGGQNANTRIDEMLGVELHKTKDGPWEALYTFQREIAADLEGQGLKTYVVPIGGSSVLGAFSFVLAGQETDAQGPSFDYLVTSSSSGSTHGGLGWHYHRSATRVIGISADPDPDYELTEDLAELAAGLDALTGQTKGMAREDYDLRMEWFGEGYGVPSAAGTDAILTMARNEGIFLDPVYSGKAFAAVLGLARAKEIGGRVLFWHTGGTPVLFAD